MSTFDLRVLPHTVARGTVRAAAELRSPARGTFELWFEVDEAHASAIVDRADPFVLAALLHAVDERCDLRVDGAPVSTSLLRNLAEFQQIWKAWFEFAVVDLLADDECAATGPDGGAVVAFSGGADSAFTTYTRVTDASHRDAPLRAGMMLHGMDIPLLDTAGWASAHQRSKRMTDSLGLELITVTTNAWDVIPRPAMHFSALGLAGALHLLGGRFGTGLVPSTASYAQLVFPIDSSPLSDWLLRSNGFELIHHGAAHDRLEKLRRLTEWDEALTNLRVCLEDPRHDRNCGRCRKCLVTYLAFRVLGVEARCFDPPPSPATIREWAGTFTSHRLFVAEMRAIVNEADRRGFDEPWVRAAKRRLRVIRTRRAMSIMSPDLSSRAARLAWKVSRR
jgi:hypothetical protein